ARALTRSVDPTRFDHVYSNALRSYLYCPCECHLVDCSFGSVVRRRIRIGPKGVNRTDHHNTASATLSDHSAGAKLGAMEHTPKAHSKRVFHVGDFELNQGFADSVAGVVDENIKSVEILADALDHSLHLSPLGSVCLKVQGGLAYLADAFQGPSG